MTPIILHISKLVRAADAPDIIVLLKAVATANPSSVCEMVNWEPPLKAKKPTRRMNAPKAAS